MRVVSAPQLRCPKCKFRVRKGILRVVCKNSKCRQRQG